MYLFSESMVLNNYNVSTMFDKVYKIIHFLSKSLIIWLKVGLLCCYCCSGGVNGLWIGLYYSDLKSFGLMEGYIGCFYSPSFYLFIIS